MSSCSAVGVEMDFRIVVWVWREEDGGGQEGPVLEGVPN